MTPGLRSFFLSSIFVYELVLIKISMNANIIKTQIFINLSMTTNYFINFTLMLWRSFVIFYLLTYNNLLTFLWTTFVLVFCDSSSYDGVTSRVIQRGTYNPKRYKTFFAMVAQTPQCQANDVNQLSLILVLNLFNSLVFVH